MLKGILVTFRSNGTPLQYSCLENPMDGGAWWAAVHGVAKSRTRLSDFTFTFHFHALEKEMATHFSVLAWRMPGMGEPGGLPSMESHRVRHDWSDLVQQVISKSHYYKEDWDNYFHKYPLRTLAKKNAQPKSWEDFTQCTYGRLKSDIQPLR